MSKILIGADIVPTKSNEKYFSAGDKRHLYGDELIRIMDSADYRVFNLEVPLTNLSDPIEKNGPSLSADPATINGIKALGVDFVSLSNNHILDQGELGLWSTTKQLDNVGIMYAGVGHSPAEAAKPHIVELNGKKIGIYCCVEHEFSVVSDKRAGANPFDPLNSLDHIAALKKQSDYIICLYHGGKEHYRYPSPNLQKICRKIVEKGANIVVCQHSHCIGCEEKWQGGTIVYGQGNFLFDQSCSEFWQTGLLIEVDTEGAVSYIPLEKKNETVRVAVNPIAEAILEGFFARSNEIKLPGEIERKYNDFAQDIGRGYLLRLVDIRRGFVHRVLDRLSSGRFGKRALDKKLTKHKALAFENLIECEANNELLLRSLKIRRWK